MNMSPFSRTCLNFSFFFTLIICAPLPELHSLHYILVDGNHEWQEAREYCQTYYATELASIHSDEHMQEITGLSLAGDVWLGLNDLETESVWVWSDNTPIDYTHWGTNEPSPGVELIKNCGEIRDDTPAYGWNDVRCDKNHEFICNKPAYAEYISDGNSHWRLTEQMMPVSGYTYGNIQIKTKMYLKVTFVYHSSRSSDPSDLSNMFRIDAGSNELCQNNYPGFYTHFDELLIILSNQHKCDFDNEYIPPLFLETNVTYTIVMEYSESNIYIAANYSDTVNDILYNGSRNNATHPKMMNSFADIVVSDPDSVPSDVTILDMLIISYDQNLTLYPTQTPTDSPSSSPSDEPTDSPTNIPTADPSNVPTYSPTTLAPSNDPTVIPTINPTLKPTQSPTESFPYTPVAQLECGSTATGTASDGGRIYFSLILDLDQDTLSVSGCNSGYSSSLEFYRYSYGSDVWYLENHVQKSYCGNAQWFYKFNVPSDMYYVAILGSNVWEDRNYQIDVTCTNTLSPTPSPTNTPSNTPSQMPSLSPSKQPTTNPSQIPSSSPSKFPTDYPSINPSSLPSATPTTGPTTAQQGEVGDIITTEIIHEQTEIRHDTDSMINASDFPLSITQIMFVASGLVFLCLVSCLIIICIRKRRKSAKDEYELKYTNPKKAVSSDEENIHSNIAMTDMKAKENKNGHCLSTDDLENKRKHKTSLLDENEGALLEPKVTVGGMEVVMPKATPGPPPRRKKKSEKVDKEEKDNETDSEQDIALGMNEDAQSYDIKAQLLQSEMMNMITPNGLVTAGDSDEEDGYEKGNNATPYVTKGMDDDEENVPPAPLPPANDQYID